MSKPSSDKQPNVLTEEVYSSIERRFSRLPVEAEPIVYEFTHDRALLHQYYLMRETMYRRVHNIEFSGAEDVYDKIGHVLIARRGKLVIGGCRLIVREGDEEFLLPLEEPNFKLRDLFSHLPLNKLRHGEVSRFAVLDGDKDRLQVMQNIIQLIAEKGIDLGLGYIFFKAPPLVTRSNRKTIHTYCPTLIPRICSEIKVPENPEYPEMTWYITEVTMPAATAMMTNKPAKTEPASNDILAELLMH